MIGWRARIGIIVPSTNTTCEYEFNRMAPEGVSIHTARAFNPKVTKPEEKAKALLEMDKGIVKAAKEVASVNPKVIAFCCTAGSFLKGKEYAKEIIDSIEKETGISAIVTSLAVCDALKKLNVNRIAMATPYNEDIADKEVEFLESVIPNLKVINTKNLGIVDAIAKGDLYPSSAYISAKEVDTPEAEAIFISCTAWRTIEIIELLENDLKKPVITSNGATMWSILKKIGIFKIEGYGKLLRGF